MKLKTRSIFASAVIAFTFTSAAHADGVPLADGNRYFELPRFYKSEVSVSEAYLAMEHNKDYSNVAGQPEPVLIDVRSLREYAAGHPNGAYNVPFPTISGVKLPGEQAQDPLKLYWEVYRIVGGRMDTPIMTLCRTGHRSVLAGNILANPELDPATANRGLQPFTNVRNIWEGFVGQPKYAFKTGSDQILLDANNDGVIDGPYQLDLNNDGKLNSDTADVHVQTKDANPDKDGWRNFAGLPWSTLIMKPLAYEEDPGQYSRLNLTPVQ